MVIRTSTALTFDDLGGTGPPLILLPGAGDTRQGHASLADALRSVGKRVVDADLPGHGGSPTAPSYGVNQTAEALIHLVDELGAGPAVVVATSFSPAAAVVAANRRPESFRGLVAISPHMEAEPGLAGAVQRLAILTLLRGPWAGALWGRLYGNWYKSRRPPGLDAHILELQAMLSDPERRRAVRDTLVADREGVTGALGAITLPTLFVFGSDDDHFPDPAAEAADLAARTGGESLLVPGAGHYPHIEYPEVVAERLLTFLNGLG
ncbi:MAG TPA: alpha/beta hydrolase [Acidimicrobiia bacterium]|nr:alpha/beta hydrolase [Acidimicrobiia bacterium]